MPPRKSKKSSRISQAPTNLSTCPEEEEENPTTQKTRAKVAVKVEAKDGEEAESAVDQFQRALQLSKPNKTLIRKLYTQRMELVRLADKNQMRRAFWEPIFMGEPEGAKLAGYFLAELGYEPFMDLLAKIVQKNNVTKAQLRGIGEALVIAYKLAEKNDQVLDMNGVEEVWRWVIDSSVIAAVPLDERFLEITKALDDADRVKFEMVLQKMLNFALPQYARCLDARARFETMNYVFRFYPLFPLLQEDREKLILDYLKDECVEIRCQATMKTMVIFESFFNIIPEDFIQHVMIEVIDSMAKDANSSVRACVYKGLRSLSQCAGAVNILEHAMRCIIVDGVNDKHEKVRLATFQLLNAVREHRFIRFWDVVEVNLLLARFEVETDEKVLEQIVRLLFRSFHPKDQTPTKIVARLERLVKDGGRNAAVNFCRHIYRLGLVTIEQAVSLIKTILALNVYGRWKKNDLGVDLSRLALDESILDAMNYNSENKENANSDEPEEALDDKATTPEFSRQLVLFECGVVMWKAIQKDLEPESELEYQIERVVLHIFRILHEKYADTALIGASFILGALVRTNDAAKDMQKFASREIENFKKGDYSSENVGFLLNFIWKWEPEELLNLVLDDLTMLSQLRGDNHNSPPKKMKKHGKSPVDSLLRIPLVISHLITSQKISADIMTNHGFYLERFFQKLSPSLPIIFDMYLSTDARVKINGQITVELFKVHLAIFEQLLATALNAGRGAPALVNILESLREFVDWFTASAIPKVNELLENEDPRWLDAFRIVEAIFEVQPLVLGLLKCGETLGPSKEETREGCDNLFTSLCCLLEALFNKGSPLQQLLLALTGLKNLAALHGVNPLYTTLIAKMAVRLGVLLPEWACSLGDDMDSDQLFQGVFGFYMLIFGKNILENDMREKVGRSLVKHLIIRGIDGLEEMHSIEDPREHDFEVSPMVRLFVHRVAFRVKPMSKLITVTLTNLLTANFFPPNVENLDALTYRLGAAAQLAYLTDASLMETGKKKARPEDHLIPILNDAQNQQTEGVRQLLSLLRDRLSELIQRDGKAIERDDGSQAQSQINNEGLLSQVKQLIEFEEPTAFDVRLDF